MHSVPTQFFDYDQVLLIDSLQSWQLSHGHCGGGHWYRLMCTQQSIRALGGVVYDLGRGEGGGGEEGAGMSGERKKGEDCLKVSTVGAVSPER